MLLPPRPAPAPWTQRLAPILRPQPKGPNNLAGLLKSENQGAMGPPPSPMPMPMPYPRRDTVIQGPMPLPGPQANPNFGGMDGIAAPPGQHALDPSGLMS